MITVLGATGGQGGTVTRALLSAGHNVRAVVRDREEPRARRLAQQGVEVVVGDLSDAASLTAAFDGSSAAFAVTTPFESGTDAEVRQGQAIIEAAGRAALTHLVLASVGSADRSTGIPHFDSKAVIERNLEAAGLPSTVVAPTYFYENALGSRDDIAQGVLPLAIPGDTPLQQVALRDLGAVVAAVIADPGRWIGRRVEVAGDAPTPRQMAEALASAAGGPVEYRHVPLDAVRKASADMGAMFTFLTETGYDVDLPRLHADFPGVAWTSFAAWAAEQEWPRPRG
ncbi:NmrA/HSCARG family protein [Streptomyces rugosispiralis]|uniref:NmrA/HSCARG family protein n=1 Tax=Streptomyces rugosispiralis TaxID=2967341 RepID=A0ABT1UX25_9ACTN|nr:NmrA/HSCARG family protein [Streptomyces rugosispiralis]MCQ8189686.1 NmrA/HSCARG family protein [Streptomyces rugosispiralis]